MRGDRSKLHSPSAKSSYPPEPYPDQARQQLLSRRIFDEEGQRTDVKTTYIETASNLQRWFSPEVEIRPEVTTRRSMQMRRKGSSSLQIVPNRNFVRYGPPDAA